MLQNTPTTIATIEPQLYLDDARAAVDYYVEALAATVLHRIGGTDEEPSIVAQLEVSGARFWVSDASVEDRRPGPRDGGATARLLLVTSAPGAVVERAVVAGAVLDSSVGDEHGWCLGRITDPFGQPWEIGHPLGAWPPGTGD